ASFQLQNQMQAIAQLEDTDRRIKRSDVKAGDLVRHLKEARAVFREDVIECVQRGAWFRVTLFMRWKQGDWSTGPGEATQDALRAVGNLVRGMFSVCIYMLDLFRAAGERAALFSYLPEFYAEVTVDSFHALRRGDPPFVAAAGVEERGLSGMVTFLVQHFNDSRAVNPDIRDMLLQSISVLLQYREYVQRFEVNEAARQDMIPSLLSCFDARFWIPISNILLRLIKGTGFGQRSRHRPECSSTVFQGVLCDTCHEQPLLFSSFTNRIFNTLNWTITEFSVAMKEMQDAISKRQVSDLQQHQRKCTIMFELSVNLGRILEFLTLRLAPLFLEGCEMNLTRLCESLVFLLSHTTCGPDAHLFDNTLRLQMQPLEKINHALILAPCVGILLSLHRAEQAAKAAGTPTAHSLVDTLLTMELSCSLEHFKFLRSFQWAEAFPEDASLTVMMSELEELFNMLEQRMSDRRAERAQREAERAEGKGKQIETDDSLCSICYASTIDTEFLPCKHQSCKRCISRQLINSARCFFCNATVDSISPIAVTDVPNDSQTDDQ
ncbi:hypothetical protein CYMTET_49961, partial [Cymbomonas tetramitiformis]